MYTTELALACILKRQEYMTSYKVSGWWHHHYQEMWPEQIKKKYYQKYRNDKSIVLKFCFKSFQEIVPLEYFTQRIWLSIS